MAAKAGRIRRTPEQIIKDLESKIAKIKAAAERKAVKKDPALRFISAAVRSVDKAASATKDQATRTHLNEARATLTSCLALHGVAVKGGGGKSPGRTRRSAEVSAEAVLDYLLQHPGSSSTDVANQLGTDSQTLRPVLHQLRDEGKIKVEGQARATRYSPATSRGRS
jgi:hypothetical protein